jgi:nicotinamide mononucleotide adenylyltransferase
MVAWYEYIFPRQTLNLPPQRTSATIVISSVSAVQNAWNYWVRNVLSQSGAAVLQPPVVQGSEYWASDNEHVGGLLQSSDGRFLETKSPQIEFQTVGGQANDLFYQ